MAPSCSSSSMPSSQPLQAALCTAVQSEERGRGKRGLGKGEGGQGMRGGNVRRGRGARGRGGGEARGGRRWEGGGRLRGERRQLTESEQGLWRKVDTPTGRQCAVAQVGHPCQTAQRKGSRLRELVARPGPAPKPHRPICLLATGIGLRRTGPTEPPPLSYNCGCGGHRYCWAVRTVPLPNGY